MSAHSLAEAFSALTSVPVMPRIRPSGGKQLVDTNIRRHFELVPVTPDMYVRAVEICAARGLAGGKVYDALFIECARQANVDRIYTFNLGHYRRLAPDLANRMAAP